MPWGVFKQVKARCDDCNTVVISKSDTEWTSCPCEKLRLMGVKSFCRIDGDNYTDLSVMDFSEVPEHKDWNAKQEDKTEDR